MAPTQTEHRERALHLQEVAHGYGPAYTPSKTGVLTEALLEATLALTAQPEAPVLTLVDDADDVTIPEVDGVPTPYPPAEAEPVETPTAPAPKRTRQPKAEAAA